MPLFALSDSDVAVLKGVLADVNDLRENTPSRPPQERAYAEAEDHQAPETYIAYPQTSAGIPALSGTTPGKATCDIWKIVDDDLIDGGFFKDVYNLSDETITQRYISITRTKFGYWIVEPSGGGGSVRLGVIKAYAGDNTPPTGTGTGSGVCDTKTVIDGLYYVDLYQDSSLTPQADICEVTDYPDIEKFCCSIIDEVSGEYIGCVGDDIDLTLGTGSGSGSGSGSATLDCTDTLAIAPPTGALETPAIIAYDLVSRILDVGTVVAVAEIGKIYVIVEAEMPSTKICFLSNIACGTGCDGLPVFLRSFTPVWIETWKVCVEETEFVPICPGTGTGTGTP